jgi:hypothetical protein
MSRKGTVAARRQVVWRKQNIGLWLIRNMESSPLVHCYPFQKEKTITFYTILWDSDGGLSHFILFYETLTLAYHILYYSMRLWRWLITFYTILWDSDGGLSHFILVYETLTAAYHILYYSMRLWRWLITFYTILWDSDGGLSHFILFSETLTVAYHIIYYSLRLWRWLITFNSFNLWMLSVVYCVETDTIVINIVLH